MRIALTGGSGFIGRWVLDDLFNGHESVVLGRNDAINEIFVHEKKIKYLHTDYSIKSLIKTLKNVDAVIHLAAKRPGLRQKSENFQDFIPNIKISSNLFEACTHLNIKNVINISSISTYGNKNPLPWSEKQKCFPETYYGLSKLCTENLAEYYNWKKGTAIKTLRIAHVIGIGEREGFMLMTFIKKAMNKETLKVFGSGEGKREYIYVKDVVRAVNAAIRESGLGGIFNIGTGKKTSPRELAEVINKVFENQGNLTFLKDEIEDTSQHLMDVEKASRELNWQAEWSIEAALKEMKNILTPKNDPD